MTPAILAAIRPHLTLFGPPGPSPATADPVVAAALAELTSTGQAASSGNQMPPDVQTVRITALASGPGNARVTRSAVIRFGAMLPRGYVVLAWGSGFD
jgi:general secretion pathway protein K